jgi:hypothetical protein
MASRTVKLDRIGPRPVGSKQDNICQATVSGMDYLRNPKYFKGLAFSIDERQGLGKLS